MLDATIAPVLNEKSVLENEKKVFYFQSYIIHIISGVVVFGLFGHTDKHTHLPVSIFFSFVLMSSLTDFIANAANQKKKLPQCLLFIINIASSCGVCIII